MNPENVKSINEQATTVEIVASNWSAVVAGTYLSQRLIFPDSIKTFTENYYQEFNTLLCRLSYDFAQNWVEYHSKMALSGETVQTGRFAAVGGR